MLNLRIFLQKMFENIETHQNPIVFVWLGNRGDLGFQNVMVSMNVFFPREYR